MPVATRDEHHTHTNLDSKSLAEWRGRALGWKFDFLKNGGWHFGPEIAESRSGWPVRGVARCAKLPFLVGG